MTASVVVLLLLFNYTWWGIKIISVKFVRNVTGLFVLTGIVLLEINDLRHGQFVIHSRGRIRKGKPIEYKFSGPEK